MPRETSYNKSFGIQLQKAIEVSGQPSNSSIYHFNAEESLFHQKPFHSKDAITPETFFLFKNVQNVLTSTLHSSPEYFIKSIVSCEESPTLKK